MEQPIDPLTLDPIMIPVNYGKIGFDLTSLMNLIVRYRKANKALINPLTNLLFEEEFIVNITKQYIQTFCIDLNNNKLNVGDLCTFIGPYWYSYIGKVCKITKVYMCNIDEMSRRLADDEPTKGLSVFDSMKIIYASVGLEIEFPDINVTTTILPGKKGCSYGSLDRPFGLIRKN